MRLENEKLLMNISLGECFSLIGLTVSEMNYLEVYTYDEWLNIEIPIYEMGEILSSCSIIMEQCYTSPPDLLTESDLIALMDNNGIGTDATHVEHVDSMKIRDYIDNTGSENGYLIPQKLGVELVDGLHLFKPYLRSQFEADLVLVCEGRKQSRSVVDFHLNAYKRIYLETLQYIDKLQERAEKYPVNMVNTPANSDFRLLARSPQLCASEESVRGCLLCEGRVCIKRSNLNHWFLGCTRYPVCQYVLWLPEHVDNAVLATISSSGLLDACLNYHTQTHGIEVNKISLKFSVFVDHIDVVYPDEYGRFVICLYCNGNICQALSIMHEHITPSSDPIRPYIALHDNQKIISETSTILNEDYEKKLVNPKYPSSKLAYRQESYELLDSLSQSNNNESVPLCQCGHPAATKTVVKYGSNKGIP